MAGLAVRFLLVSTVSERLVLMLAGRPQFVLFCLRRGKLSTVAETQNDKTQHPVFRFRKPLCGVNSHPLCLVVKPKPRHNASNHISRV